MKKVAAFIAVVLFYVFVAFGFTWAENTGAIDKALYSLGINTKTVASNIPVPPPSWPEPGTKPKLASNIPVPPPSWPEPGTKPKLASNIPVPPPSWPEPGTKPKLASNIPVPPPSWPEPGTKPKFA